MPMDGLFRNGFIRVVSRDQIQRKRLKLCNRVAAGFDLSGIVSVDKRNGLWMSLEMSRDD